MAITTTKNSLRFVCVSDTHGKHGQLEIPDGDVLIHSGDFSNTGTHEQIRDFAKWMGNLPHAHKILIAGNHDYSLDEAWYNKKGKKRHRKYHDPIVSKHILSTVCTYLENSTIEIHGLRIHGSPNSPVIPGFEMAFNLYPGAPAKTHWGQIPNEVDILITHTPPFGILDMNHRGQSCGDEELLDEVTHRIVPKFHVFGHIHECYGSLIVGNTTFINAASCNTRNEPQNLPIQFDLPLPKSAS